MWYLIADGGCKPSGSYGSYLILNGSLTGAIIQRRLFDLPEARTNNEAEYGALLRALKAALELKVLKIRVIMDSKLILNQVMAEWDCNAENLKPLCEEATELLGEFEEVSLRRVSRDVIVGFLGH